MPWVEGMDDSLVVVVGGLVAVIVVMLTVMWLVFKDDPVAPPPQPEPEKPAPKAKKKPPPAKAKPKAAKSKAVQNHALKWWSSKAHAPGVTSVCFSNNGRILASAGMDNTVKLLTDFEKKGNGQTSRTVQVKATASSGMEYPDSALHAAFGGKGKYLVVSLAQAKSLCGFFLPDIMQKDAKDKKEDEGTNNFNAKVNVDADIINMAYYKSGGFAVLAKAGTELQLLSMPSGEVVQTLNTNQNKNHCMKLSPAGPFFAVGAWASDVKIWEVQTASNGAPSKAVQVMIAKGHTSGIYDLDFSADGTKLVTVSKDGTWRLHKVDVRHESGEDVKCLASGRSPLGTIHKVAVSPDGSIIAAAAHDEGGCALEFIDTASGKTLDLVENAHGLPIKVLTFSPDGSLLATGSDDGLVRLWAASELPKP